MVKCPSCATVNPDDSKFCTGCGATLSPSGPAGGEACAGCGAAIPPDSAFCVACGRPAAAPAGPTPAHCTNCGVKLEPGSGFCTGCGAPIGATAAPAGGPSTPLAAGDMEAALAAYWAGLETRLTGAGFEKLGPMAGLDADQAFKRQRFDFILGGKVTTLCAGKWVPETLTAGGVRQYSATVFNFASTQKGLLGRGAMQPLVVYPVLVSPACPADVQTFLNSHWPKRLRSFEYPAVAALGTRELFCHRSTPVWGLAFHSGIRRDAEALFQP